jgi:uncharacterized protein YfbU (UPF0304 family)
MTDTQRMIIENQFAIMEVMEAFFISEGYTRQASKLGDRLRATEAALQAARVSAE